MQHLTFELFDWNSMPACPLRPIWSSCNFRQYIVYQILIFIYQIFVKIQLNWYHCWSLQDSFQMLLSESLPCPFYLITGLSTTNIHSLTFCFFLVTQETQTQLLLRPGGVEWSEAAGGCGTLWWWFPATLCPGERGNCQDTQPWPRANQGTLLGHPQAGAERPEGRNEFTFVMLTVLKELKQ